ncbi:hypothetical protein BGX28_001499 [Mortierella sp. GBA30]|nr:hypothetical protein BGX28_001499 [Mortierella sp. GBA30]
MGLDLLSGLTKLKAIYLAKDQEMRRKDALWIVENWTRLRAIIGGRLSSRKMKGYLDEKRHLLGEDWLEGEDFCDDYDDEEDGIEPQVDTT